MDNTASTIRCGTLFYRLYSVRLRNENFSYTLPRLEHLSTLLDGFVSVLFPRRHSSSVSLSTPTLSSSSTPASPLRSGLPISSCPKIHDGPGGLRKQMSLHWTKWKNFRVRHISCLKSPVPVWVSSLSRLNWGVRSSSPRLDLSPVLGRTTSHPCHTPRPLLRYACGEGNVRRTRVRVSGGDP